VAIDRQLHASRGVRTGLRGLATGGTEGNERLTASTGAVLIVLLAVLGLTIIAMSRLLWVHLFVGMLLIGPVALKLSSTGYRFVRYYTSNPAYKSKGPPPAPLRLMAPVVVLSTLVVFASGVALLFVGPSSRGTLQPIHKVSFFVWLAFMAIHVLAHLPSIPRALGADFRRSQLQRDPVGGSGYDVPGRNGRAFSLLAALSAGVLIAVLVIPQFAPWLNAQGLHH
jgi:hypothetical protein